MIQANTNNRWARLSQSEKAELLGIYTKAGYNDLASIIADYNTYATGGLEDTEKPSLKKKVAYRLGSAAKEGAGLTIPGIVKALVSPQKEYDELDAYLNGADKHFEKYNGKSNGPIIGKKWEGIPQYKAKINPTGEYLFPEEWRGIIDLAAQNGTTIYQNADKAFEYSPEYRYDAGNYPIIIGRSDNGYVVNSADLYDFDKDYADRYAEKNKPLKRALVKAEIGMMRNSGDPYIVREESIPIRFVGNDASQEEKDLAHQTILGIGKGETGNEFDENTAIDNILNRMGLYTGASSTITEDIPDYLRYSSGGKIHIKPENRGKFTALKKRTGHSASWFKAHGTPAQKKMATFALNARKWKHGDGGPLDNYFYNGGPYGVIPLGGDYLSYLQSVPEVSGGSIDPVVVTAALPSKFNGSQEAARRYAEGYQKGAKPISEAMNRAGQDIFHTVDTVVGLTPTPAGAISWLGHMGADTANGEYGKVGRDLAMAAAMGLGLKAIGKGATYLKNYWDEIGNFGEDTFRAFIDSNLKTYKTPKTQYVPIEYMEPIANSYTSNYQIDNLGGGYMLKSLMRGNPLEKQISKNGTVNVNNVRALVGKGSKVEQAVVDKVLASEEFAGKKSIDYNKFRKAVQDELITYERSSAPGLDYEDYGMDRIGFHVEQDPASSSIPGVPEGATPKVLLFDSPRIPNGNSKHYFPNTLGHSRTYTTADEPDVLHVMESQSDWAQHKLASAVSQEGTMHDVAELESILGVMEETGASPAAIEEQRKLIEMAKRNGIVGEQTSYLHDNYTSRQIQENLRYAAEKGQTKMRYPTRETAAKIEGYEKRNIFIDESGNRLDPLNDRTKIYTRGSSVDKEISDLLETRRNAKKITELQEIDKKIEELYKIDEYVKPGLTETTQYTTGDINNSAAESILRKYDAFPKQYQKLYKGADVRIVTDPKGNTWYEVDVPENYLQQEWAYKNGGPLREFSNISGLF